MDIAKEWIRLQVIFMTSVEVCTPTEAKKARDAADRVVREAEKVARQKAYAEKQVSRKRLITGFDHEESLSFGEVLLRDVANCEHGQGVFCGFIFFVLFC